MQQRANFVWLNEGASLVVEQPNELTSGTNKVNECEQIKLTKSERQETKSNSERMKTTSSSRSSRSERGKRWHAQLMLLLATTLASLAFERLTDGASKAYALRLDSIQVPPAVMNSTSQVMLICQYDLQGDQLYSVKWYKNWREFYSFRPPTTPTTTTPIGEQSVVGGDNNEQHWKHAFELDGINVNMAKSNATHVYLQSISLTSEGTYKCEVTNTATFATVSIERQMKVYILPKQKLTIIDNNNNQVQVQQSELSNSNSQQHRQHTLIYNVNEVVNLTCVSGPSRPQAKLEWFINEKPVPSSSKLLSWRPALNSTNARQQQQQQQQQLSESRLTLAFRLQPSHLSSGSGGFSLSHHQQQQQQVMRVRCAAKLSVEYFAESSLFVPSGGSTINTNQQQQQVQRMSSAHAQQLPTPQSSVVDESTTNNPNSQQANNNLSPLITTNTRLGYAHLQLPVYSWPRAQKPARVFGSGTMSQRRGGGESIFSADNSATTSNSEQADETNPQRPVMGGGKSGSRAGGGRGSTSPNLFQAPTWSSRQIRQQADFIEQLMRVAQPNDFWPPVIEAQAMMTMAPAQTSTLIAGTEAVATAAVGGSQEAASSEWDEQQENSSEQEGLVQSEQEAATTTTSPAFTTSEPFTTTTTTTSWPPTQSAWFENERPSDGAAVGGVHITRSSSDNNNNNNRFSQTFSSSAQQKDYELNDIGQFRCSAQLGATQAASGSQESTSSTDFDVSAAIKQSKQVRLQWFINGKDINGALVNAFDGTKFYYAQQPQSHFYAPLPPGGAHSSPHTQSEAKRRNNNNSTNTTDQVDLDSQESIEATNTPQPSNVSQTAINLMIEFSESLFQIKEQLNLRCRSVIEQPLIEFESQVQISVANQVAGAQIVHLNEGSRVASSKVRGYQLRNATTNRNRNKHNPHNPASSSGGRGRGGTLEPVVLFCVVVAACLLLERTTFEFRAQNKRKLNFLL